jgi:hypothetical protein
MLALFLTAERKTRQFVIFKGEGILYLPAATWEAMDKPRDIIVEVTPDDGARICTPTKNS